MDFAWMYHPMMVVGEISHKGRKSDPGVLWGPPERVRVSETCRLFTHSLAAPTEAGCSQEEGPRTGFVMGSRTWGVQEILEKCM